MLKWKISNALEMNFIMRRLGETGYGRYKIYILHHISLMKKLLHSILGLPLARYVYYNLKHTKHENIN